MRFYSLCAVLLFCAPLLRAEPSKTAAAADDRLRALLACQDFETCAVPPLAMDIPAGEPVEHAIRAMLRPWIWLADARGARLGVAPVEADGAAVLAVNIGGFGLKDIELNIEPAAEGGVHLWFSRALELSEVYAREREAAGIR